MDARREAARRDTAALQAQKAGVQANMADEMQALRKTAEVASNESKSTSKRGDESVVSGDTASSSGRFMGSGTSKSKSSMRKGEKKEKKERTRGGRSRERESMMQIKEEVQLIVKEVEPQEVIDLRNAVESLTLERNTLREEKKTWLTRVKNDNEKLAGMLRYVQRCKEELVKDIDAVQTERNKLKAAQIDFNDEKLEQYLLGEESNFCDRKRMLISPTSKRERADLLCDKLTGLVSTCRANQLEVIQIVQKLVSDIEQAFMDGRDDEVEKMLVSLTNIASARPGNILTATNLSNSLSEAMVAAMLESSGDMLKKRAEDAKMLNMDTKGGEDEWKNKTDALTKDMELEIQTLTTQNESMKSNLTQLRRKYTQLLDKATTNSKMGAKSALAAEKAMMEKEAREGASIGGVNIGGAKSGATNKGKGGSHPLETALPIIQSLQISKDFDELPSNVKKQAVHLLKGHITEVVKNHPLSSSLKEMVKKEVISELVMETQATLGNAIMAHQQQGLIHLEEMSKENIDDVVHKCMKTPAMHMEIVSYSQMLITYLYQRYKEVGPSGKTEDSPDSMHRMKGSSPSNNDHGPGKSKITVGSGGNTRDMIKNRSANKSAGKGAKGDGNMFFLSESGEEEVLTLRPADPSEASNATKKLPKFMQPVPKKTKHR
jgi:hypothetical protein